MNWLKHSGIWAGVVVNPLHWRFGFLKEPIDTRVFENCFSFGPIWIRIIIDNGKW